MGGACGGMFSDYSTEDVAEWAVDNVVDTATAVVVSVEHEPNTIQMYFEELIANTKKLGLSLTQLGKGQAGRRRI